MSKLETCSILNTISPQQNAVDLIPERHTDLPNHVSNLGTALRSLFREIKNLADTERAISILEPYFAQLWPIIFLHTNLSCIGLIPASPRPNHQQSQAQQPRSNSVNLSKALICRNNPTCPKFSLG